MKELLRFAIKGAPRTKKNSIQLVRAGARTKPLPSKAWRAWAMTAEFSDFVPTIKERVNCRAVFYRDANRGDAVGYYQGLADLLEKRGVVANDAQIVSWNGSRLDIDRENPRTEVILELAE